MVIEWDLELVDDSQVGEDAIPISQWFMVPITIVDYVSLSWSMVTWWLIHLELSGLYPWLEVE